jgi:hypothetical protein
MIAMLHLLGTFVANLFKSQRPLELENLFLRQQLNIALRRAPHLRLRGGDRALLVVDDLALAKPARLIPRRALGMQGGHQQHANKHKDCGCQRQKYCSHHVIRKNIDVHDFLLITFLTPLTGAQLTSVQATRNRRSQGRNSGTFDPGG